MTNFDIVNKLVGKINPVGETNTDNERFENLKEMCKLVDNFIVEIDNVGYENRESNEFSVKRAGEFATNFLKVTIGIKD